MTLVLGFASVALVQGLTPVTLVWDSTRSTKDKSGLGKWLLTNQYRTISGFSDGASGKEPACGCRRCGFDPWVGKIPWRRAGQPTPAFLPGNPLVRGAWRATVHSAAQSQTRLKLLSTQTQSSFQYLVQLCSDGLLSCRDWPLILV